MWIYLVSIAVLLVLSFYAPWFVVSNLNIQAKKKKWIWLFGSVTGVAIINVYCWIMISGNYTHSDSLYGVLYNVSGLLFMLQIYFVMTSVVLSIVLNLGFCRHSKMRALFALVTMILPVSVAGYGWLKAQSFSITQINVDIDKLDHPITFVHIPDVHLGHQRDASYLNEIFRAIEPYKPQFILYNGDLFDSNRALNEQTQKILAQQNIPQFYTDGNHEFYMDREKALSLLKNAGVKTLNSEMITIDGIQLVGLEYMNADSVSKDAHSVNNLTMDEELPKIIIDKNLPIIVAHHSPIGIKYILDYGADIYLSGHTHAGQIFPATWLVSINFPYYKGVFTLGKTKVIVSEGAGTFGPWMRLGSKNEIQIITLN